MSQWFSRHRAEIDAQVRDHGPVRGAERVIATGRRRLGGSVVPRTGFVLAVTDGALVALRASPWLARPGAPIATWELDAGARVARSRLGRLHLVLPDRTVVTLRPYGFGRIAHLADL